MADNAVAAKAVNKEKLRMAKPSIKTIG
jgi:hypothetical protein